MEIDIKDRLKSIVNKETAFLNAIKSLDYDKVNSLLKTNPEFLLPKHVVLVDDIYNNKINDNNPQLDKDLNNLNLISKEVNYTAEKNYSNFYAYANKLEFDNPNLALRTELSTDPPCNKEPLIHYISKGADVTMLTNENLNKKLQDLAIYDLGGRKVLDRDKEEVINFAVVTAIKNDDIGAFKYLDKEFKILEKNNLNSSLKESLSLDVYAVNNKAEKISSYITELKNNNELKTGSNVVLEKSDLDNNYSSQVKLKTALETKKLIEGIERVDLNKISKAISEGANVNYSRINESINKLDEESKQKIHMTVFESIKDRNKNLPEELQYKFDFKETIKLQNAAIKGNAIEAYNAIKNGGDPKGITKGNYNHLSVENKRLFENAIHKAYTELSVGLSDNKNQKRDNNLKL